MCLRGRAVFDLFCVCTCVCVCDSLFLMRSEAHGEPDADHLEQLSYDDRLRMQQALGAKREHCAMELLGASVGACKMLRYPPAEVAERIAADPTDVATSRRFGRCRYAVHLRVGRFCCVFVCAPLSDLVAHVPTLLRSAGGHGADVDDHDSHTAKQDRLAPIP